MPGMTYHYGYRLLGRVWWWTIHTGLTAGVHHAHISLWLSSVGMSYIDVLYDSPLSPE